ncbi:putative siderophore-binding lipoprotein YfiY [Hyella patelloides LEGE 07179]|uniref:Putative siderophore-binding lipoprotein YfiY n=1 Tax=Hyella patelloides LEGE 07179 TaxID=945734 RepID=A0A563VUY7_9CYAN|nr:putative siderophore-binding lipoprotein YfiY [Hyella patelloides LEGE 07179]
MNYFPSLLNNLLKSSLSLFLWFNVLTLVSCDSNTTSISQSQLNSDRYLASRRIKHAMGITTVEGTPNRVVVLTNEATDHILALGVKPIGAVQSWWGEPYFEYINLELQGVPVVGEELQPSLEKIAALKPDLIVGSKLRHQNIYAQLSQIAPTVYSETLGADWKDNFALYAQALNREEKAQQVMNQWNQRVADFQSKMGDKLNREVSLVRFLPGQARIYYQDNFAGKILQEVGLQRPNSQRQDKFAEPITLESIAEIDGDIIFYMTFDPQDNRSTKMADKWLEHPLWNSLKASKDNQVYQVNDIYWNTGAGIKAANKMLDDLYEYLLNE